MKHKDDFWLILADFFTVIAQGTWGMIKFLGKVLLQIILFPFRILGAIIEGLTDW